MAPVTWQAYRAGPPVCYILAVTKSKIFRGESPVLGLLTSGTWPFVLRCLKT